MTHFAIDADYLPSFSMLSTDEQIRELVSEARTFYEHADDWTKIRFDGIKPGGKKAYKAYQELLNDMEREDFESLKSERNDMVDRVVVALAEYEQRCGMQEVFYLEEGKMENPEAEYYENVDSHYEAGWYWWWCMPGCLPDGAPEGPYDTEYEAGIGAEDGASECVEWPDDVSWDDLCEFAKQNDFSYPENQPG